MDLLDASISGLAAAFIPYRLALLMVGVAVGAFVGIVPGLGGAATLALLLPLVADFAPVDALALLAGVAAVTSTTGDLTSILLGVPGEATTAATILDGHAMTRNGQASRAVGASLASSFVGGLIGVLTLVMSIPIAKSLTRFIGSPELFMLTVAGTTLVAALSGTSRSKGVAAAGLGFLLATVGSDPMGATPRFTLGYVSLRDGIGVIPVVLGLFAVPEIAAMGSLGAGATAPFPTGTGPLREGVRDVVRRWRVTLRASAIGAFIGILPGVGGGVSQWVAYADAARRSDDPRAFGLGAVEGVIAPSAANNATLGGALGPTLAFGLPGSLTSALLLSALIMLGIAPGPSALRPESQGGHLTLVFTLAWFMLAGNALAVAVCYAAADRIAALTRLPVRRLVPFLMLGIVVGAYTERQLMADVAIMCAMGACGLLFVRYEWPRAPLLLGLVLGPLAESRLFLSIAAYGNEWLLRPGVVAIAAAVALGALVRRIPAPAAVTTAGGDHAERAVGTCHWDELVLFLTLFLLLGGAWVATAWYPFRAALVPRVMVLATSGALVGALAIELRSGGWWASWRDHARTMPRPSRALYWMGLFAGLSWALGMAIGGPLALSMMLLCSSRERAAFAAVSAAAAFVLLALALPLLGLRLVPGALVTLIGQR